MITLLHRHIIRLWLGVGAGAAIGRRVDHDFGGGVRRIFFLNINLEQG